MRRLLVLLPLVVLVLGVSWWLGAQPSTELVDASGGALTAGAAPPLASEASPGPALDPDDTAFAEARALVASGRFSAARERLLALLETSERDAEACVLLSRAARGLEDHDEAVDYGLKAVELVPADGAAWHAYAQALRDKLLTTRNKLSVLPLIPRWREAVRRTIELDPNNVDARLEEIAFYLYVPGIAGGDVQRAIALCDELKEVHPSRGQLWRAIVHKRQDELAEAQALCEDGMLRFPEEHLFAVTLGTVHAEAGRRDEAHAAFEAGKAAGPGEAYYRAVMGQIELYLDGEYELERALELLTEYIRADPQYPAMYPLSAAWARRGRVLAGLGREDEAREAFERCLALDPDSDAAQEGLAALGDG